MTNTGTSQGPSLRKSASVGDWSANAKTMVSFLILDLYRFLEMSNFCILTVVIDLHTDF